MSFKIVFLILTLSLCSADYLPVVLWHGMGDSCCSKGSLGKIIDLLKNNGISTVVSLKFGDSTISDIESSYFANANTLVQQACDTIAANQELSSGYNAIGFSQGGQFLRAVAQRCPNPPMIKLISLGGQHQGVFGLPRCAQPETTICETMRKLLNYGAYVGWIQKSLVQAQYWHDPLNEDEYKTYSIFLADINNAGDSKNNEYAENLLRLEKLVLVKFANDTMVAPRESSWFGFYAPGQDTKVIAMEDSDLYQQDLIGLRSLSEGGQLDLIETEGDHLQFSEDWFINNILQPYLLLPNLSPDAHKD